MTNDFKRVLEVRTENLKESKSRQEKFTHGAITPTNLPIAVTNGYHKGSVLALSAMDDDMAASQVNVLNVHLLITYYSLDYEVIIC